MLLELNRQMCMATSGFNNTGLNLCVHWDHTLNRLQWVLPALQLISIRTWLWLWGMWLAFCSLLIYRWFEQKHKRKSFWRRITIFLLQIFSSWEHIGYIWQSRTLPWFYLKGYSSVNLIHAPPQKIHCSLCLHQETAIKKPLIATNNAQNITKLQQQYK